MTGKKKRKNICINCYNQHGCLTEEPLCLLMEREDAEKSLSGKILMEDSQEIHKNRNSINTVFFYK